MSTAMLAKYPLNHLQHCDLVTCSNKSRGRLTKHHKLVLHDISLMPPCLLPNYPSSCGLEHQALNLLSLSTVASCYLEQLGLYLALLPIHIFCDEFVVYTQLMFVAHPHRTNRTLSDLYDGYFQTDETVRSHLPRIKVELIPIERCVSVLSEYFLSNH